MVSTDDQVDAEVRAAAAAFPEYAATSATSRAALLDEIALGVEAEADRLVEIAADETFVPLARLTGEITRTVYQLRAFARLVTSGRHLRAVVEHADPDYPVGGPAPDLRALSRPVGPVAVFAASNFPFAFSVAGGDTASALAVGCPVIVKAHPGHPRLSRATAEIIRRAVERADMPMGVFGFIEGESAGVRLLEHPELRAAAFTGSTVGGRALFDIAARRPRPIPFYGEQGSINPVFVTVEAARERADTLAAEFVASYTLGAGQLCTKPGIIVVPRGTTFANRAAAAVDDIAPARMLNDRIRAGYDSLEELFVGVAGVEVLRAGEGDASALRPALFRAPIEAFLAHADTLTEERFGPSALIVEYDEPARLLAAARAFEGTLTATVHASTPSDAGLRTILNELEGRAGRLIYNGWPTGVTVSPAMVHGGPYPATTAAGFTSVGARATERFVRPIAYQGFPDELLPDALSDVRGGGIPRETDLGRELR